VKESWTITVLTTLAHNPPIFYSITQGASNSEKFVIFMADALPFIWPGGFVVGDNCSFHCKGGVILKI